MFRWLAAVITILVVTLGAWAPSWECRGSPAATEAAADRAATDPAIEGPQPAPGPETILHRYSCNRRRIEGQREIGVSALNRGSAGYLYDWHVETPEKTRK